MVKFLRRISLFLGCSFCLPRHSLLFFFFLYPQHCISTEGSTERSTELFNFRYRILILCVVHFMNNKLFQGKEAHCLVYFLILSFSWYLGHPSPSSFITLELFIFFLLRPIKLPKGGFYPLGSHPLLDSFDWHFMQPKNMQVPWGEKWQRQYWILFTDLFFPGFWPLKFDYLWSSLMLINSSFIFLLYFIQHF